MADKHRRRIKLSDLTDDQLVEFMDAIETDEELGFSSGDEDFDPNYEPDEICQEDERCISQYINEMQNSAVFFSEALDMSMNISALDVPSGSSSLIENIVENAELQPSESTTALASTSKKPVPSTAAKKVMKRPRSPLPEVECTGPTIVPSDGGFLGTDFEAIKKDSKEFSQITWRQRSMKLHVNEVAFRGDSSLPSNIIELQTPTEIFCYFFTSEIIKKLVTETNRAALTENINTQFNVDVDEMYHYIGVLLYMSVYRYPNLNCYWGKNSFAQIKKTMSRKRFEAIKKNLSFRDESERVKKGDPGYDPLFLIRAFSNELNDRFDSVPKHARLCVDEQMCSTKIRHHLRQYMPNKPHKWGIKLFVLCDSFGYAYRFEIYNGAGDNVVLPGTHDLGATSNVVVRLTQTVTNFAHHIIYFDNFYTSLPLLVYLRARGIYSLGTMRVNRIQNCKLPTDNAIKDKPRGYSAEFVGSAFGIEIRNVLWKDNKSVRLALTYVGIEPFARTDPGLKVAKVPRYNRKIKQYDEIDCPQIIREYNSHMGGVDLMAGLMGRYHVRVKTHDAMPRLFYHFIDMATTNAYILYRRIHAEKCNDSSNISAKEEKLLQLPEFRGEIAAGLVTYTTKRASGRRSSNSKLPHPKTPQENPQPGSSKVGDKAKHPVDDVRYDNISHFPVWLGKEGGKRWYKLCKKSQTQCVCSKCDLHLCCSNARNCFYDYHHKK